MRQRPGVEVARVVEVSVIKWVVEEAKLVVDFIVVVVDPFITVVELINGAVVVEARAVVVVVVVNVLVVVVLVSSFWQSVLITHINNTSRTIFCPSTNKVRIFLYCFMLLSAVLLLSLQSICVLFEQWYILIGGWWRALFEVFQHDALIILE